MPHYRRVYFPYSRAVFSQGVFPKKADEVAKSFVDGYLNVKGLLGKVTPTDIIYTIEFH